MAAAAPTAPKPDTEIQETWEIVIPGGVRVWTLNRRTGEYELTRVHGTKGPKRLRITKDERKYNQEIIPGENVNGDPFTNGSLVLLKDGKRIGVTDDDLALYLDIKDPELFREGLESIEENELLVRRLHALAEKQATMEQLEVIKDLLEERYKVGGTQPTVQQMLDEAEDRGETLE